jgi:ELWxxDGT repeat protein
MKQAPTRVAALVIALGGALAASLAGAQSLELVGPIDTGQSQFSGSSALPLGTVGKFVLFSASSETVAQGLWSTDGTSYGTQLVAEACPGGCQISPGLLGSDGRVAYVEVEVVGQVQGGGLWRTDGTHAGTTFIVDGRGRPLFAQLGSSAFVGKAFYFLGCAGDTDCGVWGTDGSPAGTRLIAASTELRSGGSMVVWGRTLYFTLGSQLWALPPGGTAAVVFGAAESGIASLALAHGHLFFVASSVAGRLPIRATSGSSTRPTPRRSSRCSTVLRSTASSGCFTAPSRTCNTL